MKTKNILFGAAFTLIGSFIANAEIASNIGVTSNYVWRGVTQSNDEAAVSGGLDWADESGIYLGTWASNLSGNGYELDFYGGYAGEMEEFGYDLGLCYYAYPEVSDSNFLEAYLSLSWSLLTVGANYTVDSQADDLAGSAEPFLEEDLYVFGSVGYDLPVETFGEGYSIGLTLGHYFFEDDGERNTDLDYTHGQVDISKDAGDFGTFTFSASRAEAESGDSDVLVFVSWGKDF